MKKIIILSATLFNLLAYQLIPKAIAQNIQEPFRLKDFNLKGEVLQVEDVIYYRESMREPVKSGTHNLYRFNYSGNLVEIIRYSDDWKVEASQPFLYNDEGQLMKILPNKDAYQTAKSISYLYDIKNRVSKAIYEYPQGKAESTFEYNAQNQVVKESKKNAKGEFYQEVNYAYEGDKLKSRSIKYLLDNTTETRTISYRKEGSQLVTETVIKDASGAITKDTRVTNGLGDEIRVAKDVPSSIGDYDQSYRYAYDVNDNWIRQDIVSEDRHRFQFVLRKITYADGTVTGHLKPELLDSYVEWKRRGNDFLVRVDDEDVRLQTATTYLLNKEDVLGYDKNSGLAFLMPHFKTDTADVWKPVERLEKADVHWTANQEGLWVYYKGTFIKGTKSVLFNDGVVLYMPELHQSFLLPHYGSRKDGKLYAAEPLNPSTNVFWYKTTENNYTLIINGEHPEKYPPSEWRNNVDLLLKAGDQPRYLLKDYTSAKIGQLYPATLYN